MAIFLTIGLGVKLGVSWLFGIELLKNNTPFVFATYGEVYIGYDGEV